MLLLRRTAGRRIDYGAAPAPVAWNLAGIPEPPLLAADTVVFGGAPGEQFHQRDGGPTLTATGAWPALSNRRVMTFDAGQNRDVLVLGRRDASGQPIPWEDVGIQILSGRNVYFVGVEFHYVTNYYGPRRFLVNETYAQALVGGQAGGAFRAWPSAWDTARDIWIRNNLARKRVNPNDCAHHLNWSYSWTAADGGIEQNLRRNPWLVWHEHPDEHVRNDSGGNINNGHYSYGQGQGCDRYLFNSEFARIGGPQNAVIRFEGCTWRQMIPDACGECDAFKMANAAATTVDFVFCRIETGIRGRDDRDANNPQIGRKFHGECHQLTGGSDWRFGHYGSDYRYGARGWWFNQSWNGFIRHDFVRMSCTLTDDIPGGGISHGAWANGNGFMFMADTEFSGRQNFSLVGKWVNVGVAGGDGWRLLTAGQDASVANSRLSQTSAVLPVRAPLDHIGVNYNSPWSAAA